MIVKLIQEHTDNYIFNPIRVSHDKHKEKVIIDYSNGMRDTFTQVIEIEFINDFKEAKK